MAHDPHHAAASGTPAANTWTEPPWTGWIETTGDALLILEAARRGLIPRVTRRLVDSERKMITSGSVFVFDEDESGIKRWTDGFFWSPSRILGNFLLYRETEKRGAGHRSARADQAVVADTDEVGGAGGAAKVESQTLSRPKSESHRLATVDRQRERSLVGSLTNSYKFKPGGMMKKTFSLTIGGVAQHLISYYKIEDVEQGRLRSPSSLPELASLDISPEYLDKTHFRNPPKVEIGVDGVPRYRGEADDIDSSPQLLPSPLASGLPLYSDETPSSHKRGKRYDPYNGGSTTKRSRKNKSNSQGQDVQAGDVQAQPLAVSQPQPAYSGAEVSPGALPPYAPYSYYQVPGYPVYSNPYPALPPPPTSTSPLPGGTPSPPQSSPTQPVATPYSYPGYGEAHGQAQMYPSPYYPAPHGYAAYPSGVPWPHYGYTAQPVASTAQNGSAEDDGEADAEGQRDEGGGGGA